MFVAGFGYGDGVAHGEVGGVEPAVELFVGENLGAAVGAEGSEHEFHLVDLGVGHWGVAVGDVLAALVGGHFPYSLEDAGNVGAEGLYEDEGVDGGMVAHGLLALAVDDDVVGGDVAVGDQGRKVLVVDDGVVDVVAALARGDAAHGVPAVDEHAVVGVDSRKESLERGDIAQVGFTGCEAGVDGADDGVGA